MPKIEFWLEYASTYSYLTVARIGRLADEAGLEIDWQPFWLYPVRQQLELPPPFPEGSPRERYMWRDLERRAGKLNIAYRRPETYPFNSVAIGRVAFRGIFGSPSFVVGTELFWGDDRLEDALAFAAAWRAG